MSRVIEDGIAGRGGPSMRGDHRGGLPERGRGRGVGRGGGLNSGNFQTNTQSPAHMYITN